MMKQIPVIFLFFFFSSCITYTQSMEQWMFGGLLDYNGIKITLIVPKNTKKLYQEREPWKKFNIVEKQPFLQLFYPEIEKIDSAAYFRQKAKANLQEASLQKITDFGKVRQILKNQVEWFNRSEEYHAPSKIKCRNGKTYNYEYGDIFFVAYYPQEDILLFEGGHTADVSFNLTTGEMREDAGNPEYIVFSPSKKRRLNGFDDGQECVHYFIQQKEGEQYKKIIQLDSEFKRVTGKLLCETAGAFWADDETLYICRFENPYNLMAYYKIQIKAQ